MWESSMSQDFVTIATENHVILCFLPHCTHHLLPLFVTFMAPLMTIYQVGKLLRNAFLRAAVMQTAISGFEKKLEYKLLIIPLTHQAYMENCHEMKIDNPLQEQT
ncbi:hypothetical protein PR048_013414 [Dryococelus australis]|uniref:DDE-1 domain-containing protein n=1 Tax=Dryococelus australis TaxID=614101 RepID=A0ABQ9HSX9_9NEOP|nr:hypothetical protein PR048_013414 [Dryococelus australis]